MEVERLLELGSTSVSRRPDSELDHAVVAWSSVGLRAEDLDLSLDELYELKLQDFDIQRSCLDRSALIGSIFIRGSFRSSTFKQTDLSMSSIEDVIFRNCFFMKSDFSESRLTRVRFINCDFLRVDLVHSDLVDVTFQESDLCQIAFDGSRMEKVELVENRRVGGCTTADTDVVSLGPSGTDPLGVLGADCSGD